MLRPGDSNSAAPLEGRVVRAYSNVYYVDVGDEVLECRPRGRLKYRDERVLAGDRVRVSRAGPGLGAVDEVLERRNQLVRPPVANVDQVILVFAVHEPDIDLVLVDRFLVIAGECGLPAVLCLNKTDLAQSGEVEEIARIYGPSGPVGCPVLVVSARTGAGLDDLRAVLAERVSVLAGPSGVGKSSLLNSLSPGLGLRTGDVSRKVRRGTHTTRHVSLLPTGEGGMVADTPGFSGLEITGMKPSEVAWCYPEIVSLAGGCRFRGCLHRAEPDCRVKQAVEDGLIDRGRYERYLVLLAEAEANYRPW